MQTCLQVQKLSPSALIPQRGSLGAAGYDLFSNEIATIQPWKHQLIKTGIAISIPPGNYGRVAPRSGLALKYGIDTGAGVIDQDYRGEVGVILFNFSDQPFQINHGDRIAQLILERISCLDIQEVNDLNQTQRGRDGFGSTGININDIQYNTQES